MSQTLYLLLILSVIIFVLCISIIWIKNTIKREQYSLTDTLNPLKMVKRVYNIIKTPITKTVSQAKSDVISTAKDIDSFSGEPNEARFIRYSLPIGTLTSSNIPQIQIWGSDGNMISWKRKYNVTNYIEWDIGKKSSLFAVFLFPPNSSITNPTTISSSCCIGSTLQTFIQPPDVNLYKKTLGRLPMITTIINKDVPPK